MKKRRLKLKSAAGVQSRQIDAKFCFYKKERAYRYKKIGKNVTILPPAPPREFEHPWKTRVRWYEKGAGLKNYKGEDIEGFGAVVNPGLVNGLDPVAIGAWGEGENIANILSQGSFAKAPGLLDSPIIPLPTIYLIEKPDPFEDFKFPEIPLGLRALGAVEKKADVTMGGTSQGLLSGNVTFDINTRQDMSKMKYCAVTFLYLRTARPRVMQKGDVDMTNAFFDGVKYYSKYSMENLSQWGIRSQLLSGIPPQNPVPPPPGPGPKIWLDLGFDFYPIAEIWFISGQEPEMDPRGYPIVDGGWIPFVRHGAFWNVEYRFDASNLGEEAKLQSGNPNLWALPLVGRYTIAPIATGAAIASMQNEIFANNVYAIRGAYWT